MKKAKFLLMAFAVIAVVGGALAFKVVKFSGGLFYCTTTTTTSTMKWCIPGPYSTVPGFITTFPTSSVFKTVTVRQGLIPVCVTTSIVGGVQTTLGCYTIDNPTIVFFNQ